ncbi:SGNH/GDSL hydrolase family protein [Streptomyces sp. NPDC090093]|uniref:SGNH/GDSL hydrolase family protein n=1 Tax=Streptomyces sp. NPDC090093 TaxID=3365945 RepID=UPI0038028054
MSAALAGGLLQAAGPATAAPAPGDTPRAVSPSAASGQGLEPRTVPDPDKNLGPGWKTSTDRIVTTAADAGGLRVLAADGSDAYGWKTVAVLAEPGMQADTWIGNQCVMDRSHVAVAYAPRAFTNRPDLMLGGAFAAIVDIESGRVTKLPFTASLAYFDPSCNPATGTAVFSAFREDRSRLLTVDTTGDVVSDTNVLGQVTSAVPVADGTVAARGRKLVHVDRKGKVKSLAVTSEVPSEIRASDKSGIAFLDHRNGTAYAKLWHGDRNTVSTLATGKLGDLALKQGRAGKVFLTGTPATPPRTTGTGVVALSVPADAAVSSEGRLAVDPVVSSTVRRGLDRVRGAGRNSTTAEPSQQDAGDAPVPPEDERPVTVSVTTAATGEEFTQAVRDTVGALGKDAVSPALLDGTAAPSTAASPASDPVDTDRWCSVPRNDVNNQALQPTPNQVEWAVDMAIRGELRSQWITQGGWRSQLGVGTVDPQGMFPPPTLKGAGSGRIPAQILLGVLAQESNLWQAESGAIPGQMGNPLAAVAGFYGHKGSDSDSYWKIHWDKSDCGYGIGQVTDGMRMAGHEKEHETALSPVKQQAVALDYTVNIAASMYILADKWNQLHTDGQKITVNNDDPAKPENWFAALWNYNLGFNPPTTPGAPWGLGWYNNPANPVYPASRGPFMENSPSDAANPQKWPYQEKVLGWAAWSMDTGRSYATSGRQDWPGEPGFASAGFRPAWWISVGDRTRIKPPLSAFCNTANNCDPNNPPQCSTEICYRQYWYRGNNVTWKNDCASTCGHEDIKYQTLRTEPGRGYRLQYGTPTCTPTGLPSGALIVESLPNETPTWSACDTSQSAGSFQFAFHLDADGKYEAKGDLHQIGGGYDGHFWYAHTRNTAHLGGPGGRMTITGTWTLGQSLGKWARVFAHMPDTGTHTQQAHYVIKGVAGGDRDRYVNTHFSTNKWVDLGVYHFTGTPKVELSNTTDDGTADEDIAWDAVAFQPLPGKPKHMVVAMGDSYSSGEGAGAYSAESDTSHGTSRWNACRRSANSWPRKVVLPSQSAGIGTLSDGFSSAVAFQNVTCSGAKTWQLSSGDPNTWGIMGNYHEKSQIDSGVLSPDTTLVMLTIGGNDGNGFTEAVTNCWVIGICNKNDYTARIDQAVTDTGYLLQAIALRAPNARIVLMNYPRIASETQCQAANDEALNGMADYIRDKQRAKVEEVKKGGVKAAFADAIPAFQGHAVCDTDEWINGVVAGPNGDGDFHDGDPGNQLPCVKQPGVNTCLSLESFHPKDRGTTAYATVMGQTLAAIGYTGI